jgi:hypothetical protein
MDQPPHSAVGTPVLLDHLGFGFLENDKNNYGELTYRATTLDGSLNSFHACPFSYCNINIH